MKSEHKDLLKSQTNVDAEQSKEASLNEEGQLMEKEMLAGTPFWMVGNRWDGYFLAFGRHRLGKVFETKEEVLEYLKLEMWNIIGLLAGVIAELTVNDKRRNEETINDMYKAAE